MRAILFISLVVLSASCKREPLTMYNADDSVYFNYNPGPFTSYDSIDLSFAYSDVGVEDTLLAVPIAVTGSAADRDRTINLMVDPASTAREGEEYELPTPVFHANKLQDTLFILLKRTAVLETEEKKLILRLQPNEQLKTNIRYKIALTTERDTLDLTAFTINISDRLSAGANWPLYEPYFGSFSAKKVRFMNELVQMPLNFWIPEVISPYQRGLATYYAATTARYLSEQAELGNIITDEDGSPMMMGAQFQ